MTIFSSVMRDRILVLLLFCTSCLPHAGRLDDLPRECPGPNNAWTRFAPTAWPTLAGSYRLVTVTTSFGGKPDVARGILRLAVADSATRYAPMFQGSRSPRSDRPLVGTYEADGRTAPRSVDSAEYQAGRLYIGCRHCLDGDPTVYEVGWSGTSGFGGMWRDYQIGIVRAVGPAGPAPDPAGHYCALRMTPDSDQRPGNLIRR